MCLLIYIYFIYIPKKLFSRDMVPLNRTFSAVRPIRLYVPKYRISRQGTEISVPVVVIYLP